MWPVRGQIGVCVCVADAHHNLQLWSFLGALRIKKKNARVSKREADNGEDTFF